MKALLYWSPRIFLILLIGFFLLMSMDVFGMPGTVPEQLIGFAVHAAPAVVLFIPLFLTRKQPVAAGTICIILAIAGFFFFHTYQNIIVLLLLTILPIFAGIAFVYEGRKKS